MPSPRGEGRRRDSGPCEKVSGETFRSAAGGSYRALVHKWSGETDAGSGVAPEKILRNCCAQGAERLYAHDREARFSPVTEKEEGVLESPVG